MTEQLPERRDTRHCPDCGARGILPLDQPREPGGGFKDPIHICPNCDREFEAGDWSCGFVKPPPDWSSLSDNEKDAAAEVMAESMAAHLFPEGFPESD